MYRRHILQAGVASACATLGLATAAQNTKLFTAPIRIYTPYDPGSAVDITSRLLAESISKILDQAVIVENRSGGHGAIAMNALLNAPANGLTLMTDTPASAINPTLYKHRYDPSKDLAPVAQLMSLPFAIAVSHKVQANTISELIALAKARPEGLDAAVAGTSTRLAGELFSLQNGIRFTPIPYKGAMPAMQSIMRSETDVIFLDAANLAPFIESGKMRGLLITGEQRWPALANVPTAKESGYGNFDISTWFGVFARAGTPAQLLHRLNAAILEAMASPELQQFLQRRGAQASTRDTTQFQQFFHQEIQLWRDVIANANIQVE